MGLEGESKMNKVRRIAILSALLTMLVSTTAWAKPPVTVNAKWNMGAYANQKATVTTVERRGYVGGATVEDGYEGDTIDLSGYVR